MNSIRLMLKREEGVVLQNREKYRLLFITLNLIILLAIASCSSSDQIDSSDLEEYEVTNTEDETDRDDFIFRLVSEKEQYKENEDVKLYGEIEYTGDKDEITIHHSSSAVLFSMEEKARGYEIGYSVEDIGLSTTLKQGEPSREEYEKSAGYNPNDDQNDYVEFIEDFLNRDGFPSGYYVVNGQTDFSVASEKGTENEKNINIEAEIDFKVGD